MTKRRVAAHVLFVVTLIGVAAYMVSLNVIAPIVSDDLHFSLGMDRRGLHDLSDVVRSSVDLYHRYGARLGTMVYFFISFFGRWLFIVLNPLMFAALGYLVFVVALGRRVDRGSMADVTLLLFIYLVMGAAGPGIIEVTLWATGATQYMWGMAWILAFLVPYRLLLEGRIVLRDTAETRVLMFAAGVAMGMVSETIVPGTIGLLLLLWLVFARRGTRPPAWFYAGIAGIVAGFAVFLAAPGNYQRIATSARYSLNMTLMERLFDTTPDLFRKFVVYSGERLVMIVEGLVGVGLALLAIGSVRSRTNRFSLLAGRRVLLGVVFLAAATGMIFSLFVSPIHMSSRVYFGAGTMIVLFLVIWVRTLFYDRYPVLGKYVVAIVCFLCFMEMAAIAKDYVGLREQVSERMRLVEQAKLDGRTTVRLPIYRLRDGSHIWVPEITEDPNYHWNREFAFYYGLDEVIGFHAGESPDP